jgi:integrase
MSRTSPAPTSRRFINALAGRYQASTLHQYLGVVRQALDQADLDRPNPARDRRLRLPVIEADEEFSPPSYEEFLAILEAVAPRYRDLLVVIERTGLRISEALSVEWTDLDLRRGALRVARGRTKGRTAGRRFVPLTPAVAEVILRQAPPDERRGPIFAGLTDQGARNALRRACLTTGTPHYHPHDLRGRFVSLCLIAGVPVELVRRMAGHRRTSMTLDVYSHVVLAEPQERLLELRRAVSVMFGMGRDVLTEPLFPVNRVFPRTVEDTGIGPSATLGVALSAW